MAQAELIAVGSELLLGGRQDTNSLFLADAVGSLGIEVRVKTIVGDEAADIARAVRTAARWADLVVTTGGLGPTADDRTREGIAEAVRRPLGHNSLAWQGIRQRLAEWGRSPVKAQRRQALIPDGADLLPNPIGSAPGFCLRWKKTFVVALPGVPAEAEQMMRKEVLPRLLSEPFWTGHQRAIEQRLLSTIGLPEVEVERRLKGVLSRARGVRLGLLASPLGVVVSLTWPARRQARGRRKGSAHDLGRLTQQIRRRLGKHLFAEGSETMEEAVGRQLSCRGLSLALAESCTGGLIGHRLTQVSGSSAYLDRGVVSYSNRAKQEQLGVPDALLRRHGAVSAAVAAAMARGVRVRSRVPIGLSVTGIAGPSGGSKGKPVGLVYVGLDSVARPKARLVREFRFHGNRDAIKLRASQAALNLLREYLLTVRS